MNILLASTSTLYGQDYLEYLKEEVAILFQGIKEVTFIPYARPGGISFKEYTQVVRKALSPLGLSVKGLDEYAHPIEGLSEGEAFFTGGGNTFLLVKSLHELGLMNVLKKEVLFGKPYLGCSAGSNIAGINMQTTNDMPIVYPPSFCTMGLVPFNLNVHYLDPILGLAHNGETRETRIIEFLHQNHYPVVGLREGSWIRCIGDKTFLGGDLSARIFESGKDPYEIQPSSLLKF